VQEISATEAARNFADLLDAVEHRGEAFTIVRRGKAVAQLEKVEPPRGAGMKAVLRRHQPDRAWVEEVEAARALLRIDERR